MIAGVALAGAGVANHLYQQHMQDHLNQRISEESSIEDIYNTYTRAKTNYENYQRMYQYTNTPNEGLKTFLEEMEQKMPSDITVETSVPRDAGKFSCGFPASLQQQIH